MEGSRGLQAGAGSQDARRQPGGSAHCQTNHRAHQCPRLEARTSTLSSPSRRTGLHSPEATRRSGLLLTCQLAETGSVTSWALVREVLPDTQPVLGPNTVYTQRHALTRPPCLSWGYHHTQLLCRKLSPITASFGATTAQNQNSVSLQNSLFKIKIQNLSEERKKGQHSDYLQSA